jgi:hypothetical protein
MLFTRRLLSVSLDVATDAATCGCGAYTVLCITWLWYLCAACAACAACWLLHLRVPWWLRVLRVPGDCARALCFYCLTLCCLFRLVYSV